MPNTPESTGAENVPESQWGDFLTSVPPGSLCNIPNFIAESGNLQVATPDIVLHCTSDACRGERIFACSGRIEIATRPTTIFLVYVCRNCRSTQRTYALITQADSYVLKSGSAIKIGEWPPFGPPTPARVISIVGPDRDLFLRGRRAENQGLGLGAFAYYRRVIENQRERLIGEIVRVAQKHGAKPELIQRLEAASKEQQFTKSIEMTKDAIPDSLLIDGHNPLALLHRALSIGLHELSDEECLARARSIRLLLTELAERISQVLKDTAELKDAIKHLLSTPSSETGGVDPSPPPRS